MTLDGEIQQKWSVETNILDDGKHIVPDIVESINHHLDLYDSLEQFVRLRMALNSRY